MPAAPPLLTPPFPEKTSPDCPTDLHAGHRDFFDRKTGLRDRHMEYILLKEAYNKNREQRLVIRGKV